MTFKNIFVFKGNSQHWIYNGGCEYACPWHRGKVEWHHPISKTRSVGVWLCEGHHSLLYGRQRKYLSEIMIDKRLVDMKAEVYSLVLERVKKNGYTEADIDKH